ncbi:hypothetical protein YQE_01713, partial [Dendroctonus ponderosae]
MNLPRHRYMNMACTKSKAAIKVLSECRISLKFVLGCSNILDPLSTTNRVFLCGRIEHDETVKPRQETAQYHCRIITAQSLVKFHLHDIGIAEDAMCRFCREVEETTLEEDMNNYVKFKLIGGLKKNEGYCTCNLH